MRRRTKVVAAVDRIAVVIENELAPVIANEHVARETYYLLTLAFAATRKPGR